MDMSPAYDFISFGFDLAWLPPRTWFLMGECMSKCQHIAGSPLKPALAERLRGVYLARGVQATTAIEGNTLSDAEVEAIVSKGSANVSESRKYLEHEARNVLEAIGDIDRELQDGEHVPITIDRMCALNERVLRNTKPAPEVVPGRLRQHNVVVGKYRPPDWHEVPELMARFQQWLDRMRSSPAGASHEDRFTGAVVAAILAHLYIAWIHPFGDGNGRVARLIEVQILSESGLFPLVSTNLLSDHYNKTRGQYYRALDEAQRDPGSFIHYAVEGLAGELREQIETVQAQSTLVHWESFVYETFDKLAPNTKAGDRQRQLALALPEDKIITPEQATELTTSLAKLYGGLGPRTPARDMNQLAALGLVHKVGRRRYASAQHVIRSFMPPVSGSQQEDPPLDLLEASESDGQDQLPTE